MFLRKHNKEVLISFFLRIGLAVVFFYAGLASLFFPENWVGYIPGFVADNISTSTLLVLFSFYELGLGLWLLSNRKTFYAAIISAVTMILIVIFNMTLFDVVFRDIAIFFMALALAFMSKK